MIKRPLNSRFPSDVREGRKTTTIREKPWPIGKPIIRCVHATESRQRTAGRHEIHQDVLAELARAKTIYPAWPQDAIHALGIVAEEMGELQKEVMQLTYEPGKSSREKVREEAIQLAAMALRFCENLDALEYTPATLPKHARGCPKINPK